jgi:hypothetical protein
VNRFAMDEDKNNICGQLFDVDYVTFLDGADVDRKLMRGM